ncbi:MAG: TolC family outer membrane protein [Rhodobacteraceae bacterium]|nr:TolC family outer membrane protein [Paracoccaceae bacterium]
MRIKEWHAGAALLAAALVAEPVILSAESLPDTLAAAYENSALLESSRALLRSQDESVAQAVAALRPHWTGTAGLSGSVRRAPAQGMNAVGRSTSSALSGTLQLSMELLIYDGGDSELAVESAREGVLAARQSLVTAEQSVLLAAARAFHDVLRQRELLALEKNGLRLIEAQLMAEKNRFELGEVTRTDVSLVEAGLAAAQSRVFLREGELEIARQSYKLATGNLPGQLQATPPTPDIPRTLEEAQQIALRTHPAIKSAQHTVAAARVNVKRTETSNAPRISFGGSVATDRNIKNWNGSTDAATLSITARMPFNQGGRLHSLFRQAIANAERASLDLEQTARSVSQAVAIAWARLEIAKASIMAREQQVAAARLAHLGIREEAALGVRTTLDRLDAEQQLREAETNLVTGKNDRDMAVYTLLESTGLMTIKHLGLKIPVYDPEVNFDKVQHAPAVQNRREQLERILQRTGG